MQKLRNIYFQYSNPYNFISESIFNYCAKTYYRESCRRFNRYLISHSNVRLSGIHELINSWLDKETDFDSVWSIPFGMLETCLANRKSSPLLTACRLSMRLTELGVPCEWHAELDHPANFIWGDFLIENLKNLRVVSDGQRATIMERQNKSCRFLTFTKNTKSWTTTSAEKLPQLSWRGRTILIYPSANIDEINYNLNLSLDIHCTEKSVENCFSALELISKSSTLYLAWVLRVLRGIVPVIDSANRSKSSSSSNLPGVIHASTEHDALTLAEIFIHEASHQYFYLIEQLGEVHDDSDNNLYFSPVKRMNRPVRAILLAYHAFGNILLFYRACRLSEVINAKLCEGIERSILVKVEEMEEILLKTTALTELGKALWRPLARCINEHPSDSV